MIKALTLFTLALLSVNSFAAVPTEVSKFLDKKGVFISLLDGKPVAGENGTECTVRVSPYGDSSITIDSVAYFTPGAHFKGAVRSQGFDGSVVFELTDSSKRPGGSLACGNDPLLRFKKTVEVNKDTLIIRSKFRCLLSGKAEIVEGCRIQK